VFVEWEALEPGLVVGDDDFSLFRGEFDGVLAVVVDHFVALLADLHFGAVIAGGDADLDEDARFAGILFAAAGGPDRDDHFDGTGGDLLQILVTDTVEQLAAGVEGNRFGLGEDSGFGDRLEGGLNFTAGGSDDDFIRDDEGFIGDHDRCRSRSEWGAEERPVGGQSDRTGSQYRQAKSGVHPNFHRSILLYVIRRRPIRSGTSLCFHILVHP